MLISLSLLVMTWNGPSGHTPQRNQQSKRLTRYDDGEVETGVVEHPYAHVGPLVVTRALQQSRHFRNVRMSMANLSGAGYFHPAESDHVFSRRGRSVEAPLLRYPMSPDIVSTIVSAGCIFSLRSTS
jgi:hypothetical protein